LPQGVRIGPANTTPNLNPPASASLYDLDGDGSDEIFVSTLDGKFYAMDGTGQSFFGETDGMPVPAFELPLYDDEGYPFDPVQREIRTTAAVGNLNGTGFIDVTFAANNNVLYGFEIDPAGATQELFKYAGTTSPLPVFRRSSPVIGPLSQVPEQTFPGRSNILVGGFNGVLYSVYVVGDSTATYRAVETPVERALFNNSILKQIVATPHLVDVDNDGRNDIVYAGVTTKDGGLINVIYGDVPANPFSGETPDWPTFQFENARTGRQDPMMGPTTMDLDGNGIVDSRDLFLLATRWGETGAEGVSSKVYFRSAADGVDDHDLLQFIEDWKNE
jgi:hypothetical protein